MKLHYRLLLLIAIIPFQLYAQSCISGIVTDDQSKEAVAYASVYIHGTMNGTLTDTLGHFHLENVRFPCTLIISHLSYQTHSFFLEQTPMTPLKISLQLKINELIEVSVQDRNLREQNLQTFRKQFLGNNVWGKYATIENEEVIQFSRDYVQKTEKVIDKKITYNIYLRTSPENHWSEDSMTVTFLEPANLKAMSLQPLKIHLPLLGYTLYYDLINFKSEYNFNLGCVVSSMLGYYYFVPVAYESKTDSLRIVKNRQKVYYNSPSHFCKSLFENKLAQNGYKVFEINQKDSTNDQKKSKKDKEVKEARIDSFIQRKENEAMIISLKDKKFDVCYYSYNKAPIDLSLLETKTTGVKSEMIFTMDTCIISKNGTLPYNSIIFGSEMGAKQVGSMLPWDYVPVR